MTTLYTQLDIILTQIEEHLKDHRSQYWSSIPPERYAYVNNHATLARNALQRNKYSEAFEYIGEINLDMFEMIESMDDLVCQLIEYLCILQKHEHTTSIQRSVQPEIVLLHDKLKKHLAS